MQAVTRAVIVWDHTCGNLRKADDDRVIGFDLAPLIEKVAASFMTDGGDLTLAIPGWPLGDSTDGFSVPLGMRVVPLGPLSWRASAESFDVYNLGRAESGGDAGVPNVREFSSTAFVSADRRLRGEALDVRMQPVAHVAALPMLAQGEPVLPARVSGPKARLVQLAARGAVVPLQFQPSPCVHAAAGALFDDWALFAWFSPERLLDAALHGLTVVRLNYDPGTHDVVWVRPGVADADVGVMLSGRSVLYAEPGQLLVALGPGEDVDTLGLHGEHGHTELLAPDPGLLEPAATGADSTGFSIDLPDGIAAILEPINLPPIERRRILHALAVFKNVTAHYASDLDRYSGVSALDEAGAIESRHILHPDNRRVERQLLADLSAMGYCTHRHEFVHAGVTCSNIVADLPGAGWWRVRPSLLASLRRELARPNEPDVHALVTMLDAAMAPSLHARDTELDSGRFDVIGLSSLPLGEARRTLEKLVALRPWYPWWKLRCPLPGWGAGLVIVGAHLDSTAGFDPGYTPSTGEAPGRDDNASGVAAVLALARHFRRLAGRLRHTVRFCFFNAEEAGLVGSKAYASHLKALGAPVRSVVCMDMVGYNSDAHRAFEIHAGFTDPAVRDLGVPFAERIAAAAASQGRLAPAQIYRGTSSSGGAPDRNLYDGAINRSDHAAFQQQGWGAALVSEDFFVNLPGEPGRDANPNYHRSSDRVVDLDYARDIVCAVARAVVDLAE